MKNKKILSFLIITIIAFFFSSANVFAQSTIDGTSGLANYAKCAYNLVPNIAKKTVKVYIEYKDGNVTSYVESTYASIYKITEMRVYPNQFYNSSNKLVCPSIFYGYITSTANISGTKEPSKIILSAAFTKDTILEATDVVPSENIINQSETVKDTKTCVFEKKCNGATSIGTDLCPKSGSYIFTVRYDEISGYISSTTSPEPHILTVSPAIKEADLTFNASGQCTAQLYLNCEFGEREHHCTLSKTQDADSEAINTDTKYGKNYDSIVAFNKLEFNELSCETLTPLFEFTGMIYRYVMILLGVGLVVLGMIDFSQATMSGNPDAMKKAVKKFTTRVMIMVVIFILPSLLTMLFSIVTHGTEFVTCLPK